MPYRLRNRRRLGSGWGQGLFGTFLLALCGGVLCSRTARAQAEKTNNRTTPEGKTLQRPYATYQELVAGSLDASSSGKALSKDVLNKNVLLGDLLSVSSLDEGIHLFGKPETTDRDNFSDGGYAATLRYDEGTFFDDRKYEDGTIALLEFQLWDSDWSLTVGGAKLRPGMEIDSLSSAVRQSISEGSYPKGADVDGIGVLRIAKPGGGKDGKVELLQDGKAQITVHVNRETGTVMVVRFTRLGPW